MLRARRHRHFRALCPKEVRDEIPRIQFVVDDVNTDSVQAYQGALFALRSDGSRRPVRVESVAERLGVMARHLRRAFTEGVGIGPKEFARTVRLQGAVRTAATTSNDWVRIAADAGCYDQAHLIADFRELVGFTPGAFLKRRGGDRGTGFASRDCAAA
jgi:transcriptional regulator GlxA family with amidase domain